MKEFLDFNVPGGGKALGSPGDESKCVDHGELEKKRVRGGAGWGGGREGERWRQTGRERDVKPTFHALLYGPNMTAVHVS